MSPLGVTAHPYEPVVLAGAETVAEAVGTVITSGNFFAPTLLEHDNQLPYSPFKFLALVATILYSTAYASSGMVLYGGYSQHRQEEMNESHTYPSGMTYGAGLLQRKEFYEFEVYAKKSTLAVDITHDNNKNTINHDQLQFGVALNFFLTKKLSARLGYNFAKITQKLDKPMSEASTAGAQKEYGLLKNEFVDGVNIGAGYVLFSMSKTDFLVQYDYFYYNKIKANQSSISFGIKYYFE